MNALIVDTLEVKNSVCNNLNIAITISNVQVGDIVIRSKQEKVVNNLG